jgi:hypothetical protein
LFYKVLQDYNSTILETMQPNQDGYMEYLHVGNIAIATVIVGILDLVIVMLVRTETIVKAIERVKEIIKVDYKSRAKRSNDELRLLKKHEQIARERVRKTFISFTQYGCKWTWEWATELDPKQIIGRCANCGQPVYSHYARGPAKKSERLDELTYVGLYCSGGKESECGNRAYFESKTGSIPPNEIVDRILQETIISERAKRVAKEIKKLRFQFWR